MTSPTPHIRLPGSPAPFAPLAPARAPETGAVAADEPTGRARREPGAPRERAGGRGGRRQGRGERVGGGASPKWYELSIGRTVKPEVVMAFSRQVASFLEAGISIVETLEVVHEEVGSDAMRKVIAQMSETIQRGASFSDAVAAHPSVFPGFYRAMVRSAEYTGRLDQVLDQLAVYLERDLVAKREVKSALTYPTVVLVVAIAAMVVMSIFVLPKFGGMYRNLGADLPLPTRVLLGFTDFVTGQLATIAGVIGGVVLLALLAIGGQRGKPRRDRLVMRLPVVGTVFHLVSIERFCRVLAALATAGVPLPDAIDMAADSTNNTIFRTKLRAVREALVRGGGLSTPMVDAGIFPIAARQMIRVGERTGTLGQQLTKAAAYYEREVGFRIKRATELFQPAVILFVGGIVGFVAIAQVAAMYQIFGRIQG